MLETRSHRRGAGGKDSEGGGGSGVTTSGRMGQRRRRGLRPLDRGRDLVSVAALIENAFSEALDESSRRMLREMRWLGRLGWPGRLILSMSSAGSPYANGFVWEEDGRVVGNASLIPVGQDGACWVLANVVVEPQYRRRGIGRALVEASLEHVRRHRGGKVFLQVGVENSVAQGLYCSLGFKALAQRTTWRREPQAGSELPPDSASVRPQEPHEWQLANALASRLQPEALRRLQVFRPDLLRPGPLTANAGVEGRGRWAWVESGKPRGFLDARRLPEAKSWWLTMLVEPAWQGQAEGPLLARAVRCLGRGAARLAAEYETGKAEDAFLRAGFVKVRVLVWMEADLRCETGTSCPCNWRR